MMNNTPAIARLLAAASVVASLMSSPGVAEAAVYRGIWDPVYGTPFPTDLGWRGELEVTAPSACIANGLVLNVAPACNGGMQISSAVVEFYDTDNPATTLATLQFGGAYVAAMRFSGSDLVGLITSPFETEQANIPKTQLGSGASAYQPYFSLIFLDDIAQLYWFKNDPGSFLLNPAVFPYVAFPDAMDYLQCAKVSDGSGGFRNPPCGWATGVGGDAGPLLRFTVVAVPEPTSLALVPAALAALGLVSVMTRRRRLTQR